MDILKLQVNVFGAITASRASRDDGLISQAGITLWPLRSLHLFVVLPSIDLMMFCQPCPDNQDSVSPPTDSHELQALYNLGFTSRGP